MKLLLPLKNVSLQNCFFEKAEKNWNIKNVKIVTGKKYNANIK